jgi:Rab-GTPase-TBC domain
MTEEEAFWILIGFIKNLKRLFIFDNPADPTPKKTYSQNTPLVNRKLCLKNEFIIINCLLKLHYPEVFSHLKSLGVPIEWYFHDSLASLYTSCFSSECVIRLWDMMILSSSNAEGKKRALWWLLAVPLYMVSKNAHMILKVQSPDTIKELLLNATGALTYSPEDDLI